MHSELLVDEKISYECVLFLQIHFYLLMLHEPSRVCVQTKDRHPGAKNTFSSFPDHSPVSKKTANSGEPKLDNAHTLLVVVVLMMAG